MIFSTSPFSTYPYSSLSSDVLYAKASLSVDSVLTLSPVTEFYESAQFDCSLNFQPSLYPIREINVYYIVYVTTDISYNMTLNTIGESSLNLTQDLNLISYVDTESDYKLMTMMAGDFNMAVNNSSFDTTCYLTTSVDYILYVTQSIDFILNTSKE